MAKITYYLGAGASYYSCPILDKLSELMEEIAHRELMNERSVKTTFSNLNFTKDELINLPRSNKIQILWHIGYYGKISKEFNTIDTYARRLNLLNKEKELNILKMSVSIFFDLWENFYSKRYANIYLNQDKGESYSKIDSRYISLLSILLERCNNAIKLNDNFKFISWNYDLQLESAFKSFLEYPNIEFNTLNDLYLKFMEGNKDGNNIYHLNGYRGFFEKKSSNLELKYDDNYSQYWNYIDSIYNEVKRGNINFNKHIKYAWEHNLDSKWFSEIKKTMSETDILVIIGYSFPPFNRKIDQELFSHLNSNKLIEIVYQDPNANEQIIKNLFKNPSTYDKKIKIVKETESLNQFYLPNEHFITQKKPKAKIPKALTRGN